MTSITPKAPNYDEEVDFQALAMIDPDFAKFYDDANGHVDFQDPKALQQVIVHLDRLHHSTDCD
jgi:23S rRNA (adenine1618-N6)-methyltransferase